jgi:uncharacterized membrane protein YhhN
MKPAAKIFSFIFWALAIADITGIAAEISLIHTIAKPLLLAMLIAYIITAVKTAPGKNIIVVALFFSWLGDVFLLMEKPGNSFFIFGLGSFLLTHLLYIYYFIKILKLNYKPLQNALLVTAIVVLYGVLLVWFLFPHLGSLKIPVIVYALVICTMLICSITAYKNAFKSAGPLFISGALFFVLSDSLLAINKFYTPFAYAGVWVMLTYCLAQYCIVSAFIKQQHK